jgi:hypothetical protein
MISTPAFQPGAEAFWVIGPEGFTKAEIKMFRYSPEDKPHKRYAAESDSILLIERAHKIEFIVGRFASEDTLKNVMSYAMKQKKFLDLRQCETLDLLRAADRTATLCNEFIKNTEVQLTDLDIENL